VNGVTGTEYGYANVIVQLIRQTLIEARLSSINTSIRLGEHMHALIRALISCVSIDKIVLSVVSYWQRRNFTGRLSLVGVNESAPHAYEAYEES
jgi:hypothetical protein